MKKLKSIKKTLSLSRETVRDLADRELERAVGCMASGAHPNCISNGPACPKTL